ncbi:MAG: hypothetical protein CMP23_13580 [Rickettsiales bacterium]|nr:hypothetical protein [Rickettsiales bacterium]|tara:strand:+ start:303 stop:854 length:552 start_codon:yes stop_codon:yes gene_type:complete
MQPTFCRLLVLCLSTMLLCSAALAQSPPPDDAAHNQRRAEMLEKIRMVKMYSLTEALELDEATAAKLFPYLRKHDGELEQLQQSKQRSQRQLRKMLKNGEINPQEADRHLSEVNRINIEIATVEGQQLDGLKGILSTEQRIKFLLTKAQFERKIREMIRKERKKHRKRHGKGPRGGGEPPPTR